MKIAPDSPHLNYSDYIHLEKCSQAARFRRPIEGEDGFHFDNPGARIRFCTDARRVEAHLYYSARHTRTDAVNGNGAYLRDGELKSIYRTTERPGALQLELETARDGAAHLYEIVLPYGDSVEFRGLEVNEEAQFFAAPMQPRRRWVAYGDSITHGFYASDVTRSYPFLVGADKQWQVVNMGFGGRRARAEDGKAVARLNPNVVTVAIGVNDCLGRKPLATFESDVAGLIGNIKSARSELPLALLTPLPVPQGGWDNIEARLEDYREVLRKIVAASGDANLKIIEGPQLLAAEPRYFQDGLHPNDEGFRVMARNLSSQLTEISWQTRPIHQ